MTKRHIRIYFDFGCPFCYNEWMFMKKIRPQIDVEEEYYSWEIHPQASLEGEIANFPNRDKMAKKLNELGAAVGVQPGNMDRVFNTRKALQILEEAMKQGLTLEYIDAVYHAYWEEAKNVGQDEVILAIADAVGVKGAREVLAKGRYLDVIAAHDKHCMDMNLEYVPTIEEDGKIVLTGVLSLEDMEKEFLK